MPDVPPILNRTSAPGAVPPPLPAAPAPAPPTPKPASIGKALAVVGILGVVLVVVSFAVGVLMWSVIARANERERGGRQMSDYRARQAAAEQAQLAAEIQAMAPAGERLEARLADGDTGRWQRLAVSLRRADDALARLDGPKALYDEIAGPILAQSDDAGVLPGWRLPRSAAEERNLSAASQAQDVALLQRDLARLQQAERDLGAHLDDPVWAALAERQVDLGRHARFLLPRLTRARAALVAGDGAAAAAIRKEIADWLASTDAAGGRMDGAAGDAARQAEARERCAVLRTHVRLYRAATGRLPDDLAVLAAPEQQGKAWHVAEFAPDPWGQPYVVRRGATAGDWTVASAGPDGILHTADDVAAPE